VKYNISIPGDEPFIHQIILNLPLLLSTVGLVGLVAYVPAGGDLFSVEGGNYKLMKSAIKQARNMYETSNCKATSDKVQRHQATVTTVISSEESIQLLSDDGSLGEFDIVILAAPLQMCRIKFLMHSPMGLDPSILHEMPLAGVHDNIDAEDIEHSARSATGAANNEHGARSFANPLLPSATTPYSEYLYFLRELPSRIHI
jgi:prenylcysteine oxidase/farnesylcysteine lyase